MAILSPRILVVLLALTFGACAPQSAGEEIKQPDRQADTAAIIALIEENAAASSAGNPEGVAATFSENGDGWIAGLETEPTRSRDAIAAAEGEFGSMPGFQRWRFAIDSIRFISRDAAIVEVTGTTVMDTGDFEEKTTIVVARTEGKWQIEAWRVMEFSEELLAILKR